MSQSETDTEEEQTSHRVVGMVKIWKRFDTIVEGYESAGDHVSNALQALADECDVEVTACEWESPAIDIVVEEVPSPSEVYRYSGTTQYTPLAPCNVCQHLPNQQTPACTCLCHGLDAWAKP